MDKSMEFSLVAKFIDKVTVPLRRVTRTSDESRDKFDGLRTELKRLGAEGSAITHFKKLNATQKATAVRLQTAKDNAQMLHAEIKASPRVTKKMRNAYDRARSSVERLNKQNISQRKTLAHTAPSMRVHCRTGSLEGILSDGIIDKSGTSVS